MKPTVKPNYTAQVIPGEAIYLLSENQKHALEGNNLCTVFLAIDGLKTSQEIAFQLKNSIAPSDTYASLELLEREGHIIEAQPFMEHNAMAFWAELKISYEEVQQRLEQYVLQVIALDGPRCGGIH